VLALPLAEAARRLERAGVTVEVQSTAPPRGALPGDPRVLAVRRQDGRVVLVVARGRDPAAVDRGE